MKKFFTYLSGCVYSSNECLKTWKMPKRYPFIILIITFFMLLAPLQFDLLNTSKKDLIDMSYKIDEVFKDLSIELNNKNIDVEIKDNKLEYSEIYETFVLDYDVKIGKEIKELPKVNSNLKTKTDNFIYFTDNYFYLRYVERDKNNIEVNTNIISGNYSMSNSFSFNDIYEVREDNEKVYNKVGTYLKGVYVSNWRSDSVIYGLIYEMINLIYLLLGSFVLYLFNSKGNRDYKLSYAQCFFTLMGSLIFASLLATILGFINIELFTISYIVLLLIRLFMMCTIQLNKDTKYNQLPKEIKDEDFKLDFK